jgi:homoserine dehydrogenase
MRNVNIAILGIGTVGGGAYEILTKNREMIKSSQGVDVTVKKVLDRTKEFIVSKGIAAAAATDNLEEILSDESISVVVETMGGIEPAKTFIIKALEAGKSVVTANKELISKHWADLEPIARSSGAGLYFEASCVGGVPVIRVLNESMQGNNLSEIVGIINGTTNYILTKMAEEKLGYADALRDAQRLGFAEADPTADVDGFDAVYKLSILSSLGFRTAVPYTKIYREGITGVSADDIVNAQKFGYKIKLLAIGKKNGNSVEARVHPCFVPFSHPLASVRNEFNAVFLKGDAVDDIMLYGRGAGALPTGSAIVSDIISCAKASSHPYACFFNKADITHGQTLGAGKDRAAGCSADGNGGVRIEENFTTAYYLAMTVEDKAGVLAKITAVFGGAGVSISQMVQSDHGGEAKLTFLTHVAKENSMQSALNGIKKLGEVKSVDSLIRVL